MAKRALSDGEANILKPGDNYTIVAWGRMVHEAMTAAGQLAELGINAEVIDARSLQPLDTDTIVADLSGSVGTLIVDGATGSSSLSMNNLLRVGINTGSDGTVTARNNGSILVGSDAFIGGDVGGLGGAGALNVESGGMVDVAGTIRVYTTGSLVLDGGGTVEAASIIIDDD